MNPFLFVTFLAIGATANSYGSSSSGSSYGGSSYGSNAAASSSSYGGGYGKSGEGNAAILQFNRQIQSQGDSTSFRTSNGISQSHNVKVVRGNAYQDSYGKTYPAQDTIAMNGHSYHTSPEGMHISLTWNADTNGFQASGDHLPKSVPLPAEHAEAYRQALAASAGWSSGGNSNSYGGGYIAAPQVTTISFQGAPQQSYGSNSYQSNSNSYSAAPAMSYQQQAQPQQQSYQSAPAMSYQPQQQSYQSSDSYNAPQAQTQSYQPATQAQTQSYQPAPQSQSYAQSDSYSAAQPARTMSYQPSGYSASSSPSYGSQSNDNSYSSAPARTIAYQPSGHSYGSQSSDSYSAPQAAKTMSYQPSSSGSGY